MIRKLYYQGLGRNTQAKLAATGILLINLGTPDAPTSAALRRYLAEFLSDPRVIELSPLLWQPILHGFILRTRPQRSAQAYKKIWTPQGSPLRVISEQLTRALAERVDAGDTIKVALAMRYGQPSVAAALQTLQQQGVGKVIVLPLYPQYSATSSGSALDAVAAAMQQLRWVPEMHLINGYCDHPAYLDALAQSVRDYWQAHGRGEKLLISYHGIPQSYADKGDPYPQQCRLTTQGLRARLGLDENTAIMSFQSRFGREPWLQPYTDHTVRQLARDGVRQLDVISPGFAVDCLETLEEIAIQNHEFFTNAGGEALNYIPALNATPAHAELLYQLAAPYLE